MERTTTPVREHFTARFDLIQGPAPAPGGSAFEDRIFEGMASVFGSLVEADQLTIVDPGAFTATLADPGHLRRVRILRGHNENLLIGAPLLLQERARGLFVRAWLSTGQDGDHALRLVREGLLRELSIGFDPVRSRYQSDPHLGQVRHLLEVKLWEISLVTFAADPAAFVVSVGGVAPQVHDYAAAPLTPNDRRLRILGLQTHAALLGVPWTPTLSTPARVVAAPAAPRGLRQREGRRPHPARTRP